MNKYFTSSGEVFSWISGFINLERGQKPKSFRLDRMFFLAELAGNPQKCCPSIHIAGSKGKGSVTSMLAAMLTAAGHRTSRYMSPHVVDIRERLCLDDKYFDEEVYISAGNELRHIIEEQLPALIKSKSQPALLFDASSPEGCEPTFWELLTLLFFLCSRLSKCDVMVVETGMGGRLDSTNILDPLVSIITLIELEHTSILGSTIEAIAGEKAGIIKQNKPLILAKQCNEALEVFRQTAKQKNSPLYYFPEIAELSYINISQLGTAFNLFLSSTLLCVIEDTYLGSYNCRVSGLAHKISCGSSSRESLRIPLPGKVQAENAALAITALKIAFPDISENAIQKGLANLNIPGRFEKIQKEPPFIIDGAHTPESLNLCIETFCSLYGEGGVLLFGCAADKDAEAMARIAHSHFAKIFITTPGTFKISNPAKVYEAFVNAAESNRTFGSEQSNLRFEAEKIELVIDTQEAVRRARDYAKSAHKLPILGTGSFYLVSGIKKFLSHSS